MAFKYLQTIKFEEALQQVDKKQDFIKIGSKPTFKWIVLFDGHGENKVIECIRNMDWDNIMDSNDIYKAVYAYIESLGNTLYSGATFSVIQIYKTYIKCGWVGDSQIRVYKNKKEIFRSLNHDSSNIEEIERYKKDLKFYIDNEKDKLAVINSRTITKKNIKFFGLQKSRLNSSYALAMSHSLGHNGLTGKFITEKTIYLKNYKPMVDEDNDDKDSCDSCNFSEFNSESETEDDDIEEEDTEYKVVVASDGFWDMIIDEEVMKNEADNNDDEILADSKNGANELMQIVINRWNQPWTYINKDTKSVSKDVLIGTGDDISIGVWVGKI
jgi:serine/threonine protein phosphatase PrpC